MTAQFAGFIFGAILVFLCQIRNDNTLKPGIYLLCPLETFPKSVDDTGSSGTWTRSKICDGSIVFGQVFLIEMIVTFLFVSVVLIIKYQVSAKDHVLNSLAMGAALFAMLTVAKDITGACLNPSIGLV